MQRLGSNPIIIWKKKGGGGCDCLFGQWFLLSLFRREIFFLLKICKGHTREKIWYWNTWKFFGHKGDRHWINSFL